MGQSNCGELGKASGHSLMRKTVRTINEMDEYNSIIETMRTEIKGEILDVRKEFLDHFDKDTEQFLDLMAQAFLRWLELDGAPGQNEKKDCVSGLVFSAITQHIISLRLFLSGYIVAAGNTQRQVLETIALALLCSCDQLNTLDRFLKDEYSTNYAVRDALKHSDKLNVEKAAVEVLRKSVDFYHMYSHPTLATLASHIR